MNEQIVKGKWKQLKGNLKQVWGKLTNDDLKRIDGKLENLIGVVQERYGHSREQVEREYQKLINKK